MPAGGEDLVSDEEDDPLQCSLCLSGDASAENEIIKCDGAHDVEVGCHMKCVDLDEVPTGEWYCPQCQSQGLWQVESVCEKKTMKGSCARPCVHYKVHWKDYSHEFDTWEPHTNIPASFKKAFNAKVSVY